MSSIPFAISSHGNVYTPQRVKDFLVYFGKTNIIKDWDGVSKLQPDDLALTNVTPSDICVECHIITDDELTAAKEFVTRQP